MRLARLGVWGAAFALGALFAGAAEARTWNIRPGADAQQQLQTALIEAHRGDTVHIARGHYDLVTGLSLDIERVTIRGDGQDKTILNFAHQTRGAEGLLVTSDHVVLQDFAVEDAKGDAIKIRDCHAITVQSVRTEWTGGPSPHNGAYGIYPVNCDDVLIRNSIARGASDTGIYVGQSRNIIVRDNEVDHNVAGIEIENSFNADVFSNVATHNTGGILVFDLPQLQQQDAHAVRVFHNQIVANDTPNFAPSGNTVAEVPTGTGVLVMATRDVVVFDNDIGDNGTANVIVTAYRNAIDDPHYNALPRNILIRNNRFGRSGFAPAGDLAQLAQAGVHLPDILWDGATTYTAGGTPHSNLVHVVVKDNRSSIGAPVTFLSLGVTVAGSPLTEAQPDPTLPPLIAFPEPDPVRIRN